MKIGTLSLLSEPRFCLSDHRQHGGQGLSASPWVTAVDGWVARAPQEDPAQTTKGLKHELAKTCHAMRFKKYILFLYSWQVFLQTVNPLRDLFPFPTSLFLACMCMCVCVYIQSGTEVGF